MSLVRLALRICAVEAVKGKTLVGDNVLDSEIGAISTSANGEIITVRDGPFIAIYTDKSNSLVIANDVRSLADNGTCELVFELGITSAMSTTNKEDGTKTIVGIETPVTDRNLEYYLDMTGRQIKSAITDPSNTWSQMLMMFASSFKTFEVARAANQDGTRFAAHQIKIVCELLDDPIKGEPLVQDGAFDTFLAMLDETSDATYAKYAADIRAEIAGDETDIEALQRRLGLRADELLSLGYGNIDGVDNDPDSTSATIEVTGLGTVEVT